MTMMKVTLVCGGPSSEHEVSINSTKSLYEAIDKSKYEVSVFYITKDLKSVYFKPEKEVIIPDDSSRYRPFMEGVEKYLTKTDLAFLAGIHGEFAEDGKLQTILEFYGIHYTGSGPTASAICMDKFRTALIVNTLEEISLPNTTLIDLKTEIPVEDLAYPLIFKPNSMGSSVGLHIINSEDELRKHVEEARKEGKYRYVLLQEYIKDAMEVTCGCLEDREGNMTLIPPVEIIPNKSAFFDYASKYDDGGAIEVSPPKNLDKRVCDIVSELAANIHTLLGCKTYSRSDFLYKDDTLYYMETNTLPGMTKNSLFPKESKAIGMSFPQLIDFLIENAQN